MPGGLFVFQPGDAGEEQPNRRPVAQGPQPPRQGEPRRHRGPGAASARRGRARAAEAQPEQRHRHLGACGRGPFPSGEPPGRARPAARPAGRGRQARAPAQGPGPHRHARSPGGAVQGAGGPPPGARGPGRAQAPQGPQDRGGAGGPAGAPAANPSGDRARQVPAAEQQPVPGDHLGPGRHGFHLRPHGPAPLFAQPSPGAGAAARAGRQGAMPAGRGRLPGPWPATSASSWTIPSGCSCWCNACPRRA